MLAGNQKIIESLNAENLEFAYRVRYQRRRAVILEVRVFTRARVRWEVVEELWREVRQHRYNRRHRINYRLFLIIDLEQLRLVVTTSLLLTIRFLLRLRMKRTLLLSLVLMALLRLPKNGDRLQRPHTEVTIHRHTGGADEYEGRQKYVK